MAINISETLFERVLSYLQAKADSDRTAKDLLALMQGYVVDRHGEQSDRHLEKSSEKLGEKQFGQRLFGAWKELADLHVGENCWSYPVDFADLAESLSLSTEKFVRHLEHVQLESMQLLVGRGQNYLIQNHQVGALTFHGELIKSVKSSAPKPNESPIFKVGDRVRVNENANRPQYANHVGIIEQVISVSCKVKLDNGWTAFLPNQCLELI